MLDSKLKEKIIDGRGYANSLSTELKKIVDEIKLDSSRPPTLAIIMVGDNPASKLYVNNKLAAAKKLGLGAKLFSKEDSVTTEEISELIQSLNQDENISGIILQLPLPRHIDKPQLLSIISPKKDVDGFNPLSVGKLALPKEFGIRGDFFTPCTALGCYYLLRKEVGELRGKNVVIVGRSSIVGRPTSYLLLRADCSVTICHSHTKDLKNITKSADIIISAMGRRKFITKEYCKKGVVIIDVGINKNDQGKFEGDTDFDNLLPIASKITPVPGGVGPMTVIFLMINTVKAFILQRGMKKYLKGDIFNAGL